MLDFALGMGFAKKNLLSDAIIYALFANGEEGAYYDPYDLTDEKLAWVAANPSFTSAQFMQAFPNHTLFQDSLGTIPVTGHNQPVGLGLDKRFGGVRGEQLIANSGAPFTDTNAISTTAATLAINDGKLRVTSAGGFSGRAAFRVETIAGVMYEFTVDLADTSAGDAAVRLGTGLAGDLSVTILSNRSISPNQKHRYVFTAQTTTTWIAVLSSGAEPEWAEYRSIKCRPILGNHASQPLSASRPLWQNNGGLKSVWFDGLDDCLVTVNPMDLSGTSEVSVFAGVRKERSTIGTILHIDNGLSATTSSNQIELFAPFTSAGSYAARLSSSTNTSIDAIATGFNEPSSNVIYQTANGLIATSTLQVDKNSTITSVGAGTTDELRSGHLVIGARNLNNLSAVFQGHIYSLTIRSTLTPEAQADKIQQLLATRSGVTL